MSLLLALLLVTPGCQNIKTGEQDPTWKITDLRLLEAPNAPEPTFDLIAVYLRERALDVELRFDLLGSPGLDAYDFYLVVDNSPGAAGHFPLETIPEIEWDLLLVFPAKGLPRAVTSEGSPAAVRPRSIRSFVQDSFSARVNHSFLGEEWQNAQFQGFITRPGSATIEDSIGPFRFEAGYTYSPAPLALVFWDVLPAATPAQALRRWNGAHTGPFGQRHGLQILLKAAEEFKTPLFLLDLQRPDSLAALEALGGLGVVQEMQKSHLLAIPDTAFGDEITGQWSLQSNIEAAQQYQLKRSSLFFGLAIKGLEGNYKAVFGSFHDANSIRSWEGTRIIPLPIPPDDRPDTVNTTGLTVETRRLLLRAALTATDDDLVILGGSLPSSPWGDLLIAQPALADITAHPWIKVLGEKEILAFPVKKAPPECASYLCPEYSVPPGKRNMVRDILQKSPDNLFSQIARDSYLELTWPVDDQRLAALRTAYLTQLGPLLSAAWWVEDPSYTEDCNTDLDWDSNNECILATENYFFAIDPEGGRLVFGAAQTNSGPVQLVGQRSQFIVGLGDPSGWKPELNQASDPEDIPGGFIDVGDTWRSYEVEQQPGTVILSHRQTGTRKIFHINDQGLHVTLEGNLPVNTKLPLAFLDRSGVSPGTYLRYNSSTNLDNIFALSLEGKVEVIVQCDNGRLLPYSFLDSMNTLTITEDPNLSYHSGHRVPFPLVLLDIQGEPNLSVHIQVKND